MKHQEARCRFHAVQIRHGNNVLPLHGFFIEGYKDNSIGPHPVVHRNQPVYSVTWLAWAAVELVLALNQLMKSALLDKYGALDFDQTDRPELRSALKEAARLPAYSFGEAHFLSTALPTFIVEEPLPKSLTAGQSCYGSIYYPWSHGQKVEVVGGSTMHMGDGQTKTFEIVSPERGVLINWNVARSSF